MPDTFVREMEQLLVVKRTSLEAELVRHRSLSLTDETQSEHAGLGNHMADDASDLFEQEKNLSLQQNTAHILAKVEAALRKVKDGSYGMCETCGQPIDRARLETLPYAMLCVRCKTRQEKA